MKISVGLLEKAYIECKKNGSWVRYGDNPELSEKQDEDFEKMWKKMRESKGRFVYFDSYDELMLTTENEEAYKKMKEALEKCVRVTEKIYGKE